MSPARFFDFSVKVHFALTLNIFQVVGVPDLTCRKVQLLTHDVKCKKNNKADSVVNTFIKSVSLFIVFFFRMIITSA